MRRTIVALLAFLVIGSCFSASAQTFDSPPLLPSAFDPIAVAAGDFNQDGNPDLVYVDGIGSGPRTLHVLLGHGDGTFFNGQALSLPASICAYRCSITAADVSSDGKLDLITAGNVDLVGEIVVLLGNGDGTFQEPLVSTLPASMNAFPVLAGRIGIGDFNGDGAPDLAVPDPMNNLVYILLGDNSGAFNLNTSIYNQVGSTDLRVVDLNRDGHLDLVALGGSSSGGFDVYIGNGDGTFHLPVLYSVAAGFKGCLADVDGDGQPDIVATIMPAVGQTQIIVLRGQADGTFASPITVGQFPNNAQLVDLADFNGDGMLDLEASNATGVGILLGQPRLGFGSMISSLAAGSSAFFPAAPAQADFNKDGHLDLAMVADGGIVLLMGQGDGSFASGARVYDLGSAVTTVAVADFNGDKLPDIAVAISAPLPRLLLGEPGGTFVLAPNPNTSAGSGPGSLAVGDFNGDGHADLALGANGPFSSPAVLFGDGNGGFSAPVALGNGSTDVADFNSDGRSDLINIGAITFGACFEACPMVVSLGQTNNTFAAVSSTALGITFPFLAAIGDLNGDGVPDMVLNGQGYLEVWLGKGDGTFSQGISLNISSFRSGGGIGRKAAAIVDLDGDGKNDFVLTPAANPYTATPRALMVLYGKGDGTFEAPVLLPLSHYYGNLNIADVNQDHQPDLILDDGLGIAVILNLGNRAFQEESHYAAGTSIAGLTAIDVNGDGFPDLVVANPGSTTVAVLLNNPTGVPPGGLHVVGSLSIAPEPSNFAAPFSASAIIAAPNLTSPAPTGMVNFFLDGALAGAVPLSSGAATFTFTGSFTPGLHNVVATYSGDQVYSAASINQIHTINPRVFPTQTVLTATPGTVLTSQTVHLVASVSAGGASPCNGCLWGKVTFLDGTRTLSAQTADENGIAVFDTALLTAGIHTLSAVYHGLQRQDEIFQPSTSAPVPVTVNSTPTTTTLKISSSSATAGTVVTLSASVSAGTGTPFGGVTFYDGTSPFGTMALDETGTATFSVASLSIGTHSISASFNANATFAGSSSPAVSLAVQSPPSGAIPTFAALSTMVHSKDGTFVVEATVAAAKPPAQSRVIFLDGGVILGAATTNQAGVAILALPVPHSGTHILRASFSGTSEFAPTVSPELREYWPESGPGFSLRASPAVVSFNGAAAETEITMVTPTALQNPVQLACLPGLPAGYTCMFSPSSLPQSGGSHLSIHATAVSGRQDKHASALVRGFTLAFLLAILVFGHRRTSALLILLCCTSMGAVSGCAGASLQRRTPAQVITIQATSGAGQSQIVHSTQIVLIIPD